MSDALLATIRSILEHMDEPGSALFGPLVTEEQAVADQIVKLLDDVRRLEALTERLDADGERRRLAYRQLLQGFKAVQRVSRILLDTTDVDAICDQTVRIVVEHLGADNCSILLLNRDRTMLRLVAAHGRGDASLTEKEREARFNRDLTLKVGEGVAGQVVTTGRARFLANVDDDPAFKPIGSAIAVRSLYSFPLRAKSQVMGVINVSHPNLENGGTNLRRLMVLLSSSIGQVITIARLHRRLITEEHERHAKLANMGEMAASVAHEINNPVTNVLLRAQRLKRSPKNAEKVVSLAEQIEQETYRITKIVSKLLDVGPNDDEEPAPQSLNEVVEDTLILTEYHLRSKQSISVRKMLQDGLPEIKVVRRELEQVFTNLITNAARAMPDGGDITIITRFSDPPPGLRPGRYVAADFIDTGRGIPPEHLSKIFQPFFTTGRPAGGTGLGLPISREIIDRSGGAILVESEVGEGTTFTVVLPAV
jgi:signal transduction histidine kinase